MTIHRHPLRGLFGGFLLGLGLALALVFAGLPLLGTWTVIAVVVAFTVLGVLLAYVLPARPPSQS